MITTPVIAQLGTSNGYNFEEIVYPGALVTHVTKSNDLGNLSGSFRLPSEGRGPTLHAFTLIQGVFTRVDFPGALFTRCIDINNRDEAVCVYMANNPSYRFVFYDESRAIWKRTAVSGKCE
jgi:hypothetical protein